TSLRLRVEGGGKGGAAALLAPDAASFPLTLDLALGKTRATARGGLAPPLDLGRIDAAFTLEGEDPGSLLALFDLPALELPPYRLAGNLAKRGDTYGLSGLEGRVGDSDIAGELSVRLGGPRPSIGGNLHSRLLDFDDLGGLLGAEPATGAGETASGEQRADAEDVARDDQVIPDDKLDPARWNRLDADVRLRADKVRAGSLPLDGFELGVSLQAGRLKVEPLVLSLGEGRLAGRAGLDARRVPALADLDLDLSRLPVDRLLSRLAVDTGSLGTLSGRARGGADISGAGLSLAEILATADGELTLLMEGGTINRRLVTALGFDLLRLLGGALGFSPEQLELRCALADLVAKDGVLTTRALAIDTPAGEIGGEGSLDLRTERLDLALLARPQGGALPAAGRTGIRVTGTLAEPEIGINPAALLARGAAAATLGVLLRPFSAIASGVGGGGSGRGQGQGCAALLDEEARRQGRPAGEGR
ncbi:MAG TPA: AsmA family protein, partial [Geminicoccaceae bacterium]